jgi:glycosyltransferase involved in cell wall biosynthesis
MKKITNLHVFALAAHGIGLSGGDRIFIELSRRWSEKVPMQIYVWEEGYRMCLRQGLKENKNLKYKISNLEIFGRLGFVICYFARIIEGIKLGLITRLDNNSDTHIYSASEFWMDSLPCVILKIRFPKVRWIATWFQTAPNPIKGFAEGVRENRYSFSALLYWLMQFPIKPLISRFADKVIVNNEEEKKRFPKQAKSGDTVVLIGAVPLKEIKKWQFRNGKLPKKYDAVFQGRFHPQKGVVELIGIWKKVVEKKPDARLAMIGDGPLMQEVKSKVLDLGLQKNVELFGYVFDGPKKYQIFAQSKIVVHPSYYDSGGMATAEAMAFGVPAVGFDLRAYLSYYPKGMIKSKDEREFASNIIALLNDKGKREALGEGAKDLIMNNYSWDKRSEEIYKKII